MWQFQTIYKYTVRQALSPVLRNMIVQNKQLCPLGDDSLVWFESVNVHISELSLWEDTLVFPQTLS